MLLEWERMQQSEGEKVWIFRGRVQMFLNALGFDPSLNVSNGERCRAEVLLKLLPLLQAEAEQSYNLTALSWEGLWERLERVEESYGLEVQRAMAKFDKGKGGRGDGGTCPLPPEAELEGGRGRGGGGGAGGEAGAGELATLRQLQVPIHQTTVSSVGCRATLRTSVLMRRRRSTRKRTVQCNKSCAVSEEGAEQRGVRSVREFSQVFSGFIAAFFFGIFITFVFGFITPFRLYDGFARITYI